MHTLPVALLCGLMRSSVAIGPTELKLGQDLIWPTNTDAVIRGNKGSPATPPGSFPVFLF
jgi:hypothetical protein